MISRKCDMKKVEGYLKTKYYGVKKYLPEIDEAIFLENVIIQFFESLLPKDMIPYLENGKIDLNALKDIIGSDSSIKKRLKISVYDIGLQSGAAAEIKLELATWYISLSTESELQADIDMVNRIESELILCRGITPEDIEKKNMFYYHYQMAKKF